MRDDHPAEEYRAVMAGLDTNPPPEPPPLPPKPRSVVVVPPPQTSWWDVLRGLAPILAVVALIIFAFVLYHLTH